MANDNRDTATPRIVTRQATVQRPNDADPYTAGDALSDSTSDPSVMELTNCSSIVGYGGLIVGATLVKSTPTTTDADFDVYILDAEPTALEDNETFDLSDEDAQDVVTVISFTNGNAKASSLNAVYREKGVNAGFVCGTQSRSLWAVFVPRAAYAPGAQEQFTLTLDIIQE